MNILLKPVITEKMTRDGEDFNRYGFVVPKSANKVEIRKAVESMYGVTVKDVNTMITKGKYRRRGMRISQQPSYKKAIVKLHGDQKIALFEEQ